MPIYEYLSSDGTRHERIYLMASDAPSSISVDGEDCPKVPSVTVNKFKGAFSGGTSGKDRAHINDGTVLEPGRSKDVQRRRKEITTKSETDRQEYLKSRLAEYDL